MQKINTISEESKGATQAIVFEAGHDFKVAAIVVSLAINLFFFVAWVTLETMSQASGQSIGSFLQ